MRVAMSAFSSMCWIVASYVSPLCSCTLSCCRLDADSLLLTTCALVRMRPLSETRKPEPLVMGTLVPNSGCLRGAADGETKERGPTARS